MARQVKPAFFVFVFITLGPALSLAEPSCGKVWVKYPSNTTIYNGRPHRLVLAPDGKSSTIQQLDQDGKTIKEVKIGRPVSSLMQTDGAGDGYVYNSEGKMYHFDVDTKSEYEIETSAAYPNLCSGSSVKSSIYRSCSDDGTKTVYDFKSHKKIVIPDPTKAAARGQSIAYSEAMTSAAAISKVTIHDFSTGKKQTLDVPKSGRLDFPADNRISIDPENDGPRVNLVKVNGNWKVIEDSASKVMSGVTSDGSLMFANFRHKSGRDVEISLANFNEFEVTTEIFDKTGTRKKATLDGYYASEISGKPSFFKIEYPTKFSLYSEKDLKKLAAGEKVKPMFSSDEYIPVSQSGKWTLKKDPSKNKSELINLETKKSIKLSSNYEYMSEPESGPNLILHGQGNSSIVINTETGKIRHFLGSKYPVFDKKFENWYALNGNETLKNVCLPDTVTVIDDDCDCLIKNADNENPPLSAENLESLQGIALAAMCQADGFDRRDWEKITPKISKGEISKRQAKLYLKRFQKKTGYDPSTHLPVISAILKSDMVEKEPELVMEALKMISVASPAEVRKFYNIFNLDQRIPEVFASDESNSCKAPADIADIKAKVDSLKRVTATTEQSTSGEDWLEYMPFRSDLQKLPKSERSAIVDGIAESISQAAGNSAELNGVFQSKLFYFSKKFALRVVGETAKPATDLAIAVRNGQNIPVVLGSGELVGARNLKYEDEANDKIRYGFNYKVLDPIEVGKSSKVGTKIDKQISWRHEEQNFNADVKTTVLQPLGNLIPKDKAPNYSALKKDGKLTGVMIVGSNLSSGRSQVVDEYLTYYQNQGFEFKEAKEIDAISFFKESVQSGEMDYLIKEAHSDGDDRNLFRANTRGKLFEGKLDKADGTKEVIYLVAPLENNRNSKLISNQEFGSWVRERGKDQPLVYLNASCNSERKVVAEIAATHSPNFVPIPSGSSVLTFRDSESNGERQILQAFREGKSYEGIRENLKRSSSYQKGYDRFVFPDDAEYDTKIRNNLIMNLDIEVKIRDSNGKELHIDQNLDH